MIVIFSTKLSLSRILTVSLVVISDDGLLMLNVPLTPPLSQSLMYPRPVSCVPTLTPPWAVRWTELNQPPVTGILTLISPITAHQNKDNITRRMNLYDHFAGKCKISSILQKKLFFSHSVHCSVCYILTLLESVKWKHFIVCKRQVILRARRGWWCGNKKLEDQR